MLTIEIDCSKINTLFIVTDSQVPARRTRVQYNVNQANLHKVASDSLHRVSIKNKQNYYFYNYVKLPPTLTIFGIKMANGLKLCALKLY